MLQGTKGFTDKEGLAGGLVTTPNFFALGPAQTPNCLNVSFGAGSVEKRLGTQTTNAVVLASTAGWGMFDFGAGKNLRWLMVAAGTAIYASSNRGTTFVIVSSSRSQDYAYFERSKAFLIATSDDNDPPLYWAGSVSTVMLALATGSAPDAKFAISYQGFLLLMNSSSRKRGIYYADDNLITTDPWNNSFDLPSSFDDEITGGIVLNRKLYVFTKYKVFRISYVGGNPDFAYQDVKDWGAVPRTMKKVTLPKVGEVIICMSFDRRIRIFDGAEDDIISDPIEFDNGLSPVSMELVNQQFLERNFAELDTNDQVYKLWVALGGSTRPTHLINFDVRGGTFYPYSNQTFMSAAMVDSGGASDRLLMAVTQTGWVYILDTGNTDAGMALPANTAVDEYYDSRFYFGRTPRVASKAHQVSLYFQPTSSGTLYFQERVNFAETFRPARETIVLDSTAGTLQVRKTIDVPQTQNVYQFRITSSASTAEPWVLNRMDFEGDELGVGRAA